MSEEKDKNFTEFPSIIDEENGRNDNDNQPGFFGGILGRFSLFRQENNVNPTHSNGELNINPELDEGMFFIPVYTHGLSNSVNIIQCLLKHNLSLTFFSCRTATKPKY